MCRAEDVTPRLSIVVVSYRRHLEITRCLGDLARQATTVPFEVVLMLQAYPDGAPEELVTAFARAFPLSVFHSERGLGVHAARNAALSRCSGEIVAFLDDDVRVPRDWIET